MIAVRRRSEAAAGFWLEIVFTHQPADLLVVDDLALLTKGGSDTTPPVMFELITDGGHRLDDCCVVRRGFRAVVKVERASPISRHPSVTLTPLDL